MARTRKLRRRRGPSSRRSRNRRSRTRRNRRRSSLAPRPRSLGQLFPDRLLVKMRYTVPNFYASNLGNYSETVMRGNNVYDPEVAVGGHQPMGYDNFAGVYDFYYVHGARCSAAHFNLANNANNPVRIYIIANEDPVSVPAAYTQTEIDENVRNKISWTSGILNQQDWNYRGLYRSTKRMLAAPGRTSYDAQGSTSGSVTPAQEWYFHVVVYTINGANFSLSTNQISIRMTYWVEFSQRSMQFAS